MPQVAHVVRRGSDVQHQEVLLLVEARLQGFDVQARAAPQAADETRQEGECDQQGQGQQNLPDQALLTGDRLTSRVADVGESDRSGSMKT